MKTGGEREGDRLFLNLNRKTMVKRRGRWWGMREEREKRKKRHSYHERLKSCDRFTSTWLSLSLFLSPAHTFFVQLIPPVTHSRPGAPFLHFSRPLNTTRASPPSPSSRRRRENGVDQKERTMTIVRIFPRTLETREFVVEDARWRWSSIEQERKKRKMAYKNFPRRKIRLRPRPRGVVHHRSRWCIAWQWHHRPPDNQLSSAGSVSTAKRTE